MQRELAAGQRLRELLGPLGARVGADDPAQLVAAMEAAAPFPGLAANVAAACTLHVQAAARAAAAERLQRAVQRAADLAARASCGSASSGTINAAKSDAPPPACKLQGFAATDCEQGVAALEAAAEEARNAGATVPKV
jgi:hypothetical protein